MKEFFSEVFVDRQRKTMKSSWDGWFPDQFRTQHLPNASLERYRGTSLLENDVIKIDIL
jgi:hypothetical protein